MRTFASTPDSRAARSCASGRPCPARVRASRAGFTLLEVLAAVALTALVVATALGFQMQLSNSVIIAAERTERARMALAILDRVARDLQSAILLEKPPELDPLEHPWIFLGESAMGLGGADRIKFVRSGHQARSDEGHASDVALVSYFLSEGEEPGYELRRWVFPRLPDGLDRNFPSEDDEISLLLADGLAHFSVYFFDEIGGESGEWDSSMLARSSQLPVSARIEVAMLEGEDLEDFDPEEATIYSRRVVLPLRPIETAMILPAAKGADQAGEDEEETENDDLTISQCLEEMGVTLDQALDTLGLREMWEISKEQLGMDDAMLLEMPVDSSPIADSLECG